MDAGREVDEVDVALALEVADDPLDVLELEVARPERRRVDPVAHERLVADRGADPRHRLDRETEPVLVRAAPAVGAVVVQRREELPRQVAVRHVELDAVDARRHGAPCRRLVPAEDLLDLVLLELLRHRRVRVLAGRDLARRDHVPLRVEVVRRILVHHRHRAQPDMEELARELAAMLVDGVGHLRESGDLLVVPEAREDELRVQGLPVDDRAADDDQPAAALRPLLVVRDRLVGEDALVRVRDPGRAGRREDDPVRDRRVPDPPLREEVRVRRHGARV